MTSIRMRRMRFLRSSMTFATSRSKGFEFEGLHCLKVWRELIADRGTARESQQDDPELLQYDQQEFPVQEIVMTFAMSRSRGLSSKALTASKSGVSRAVFPVG